MKKNTILSNLFQKIIPQDELLAIQTKFGYEDVARKLTVSLFTQYFITAAANEFKSFRHCADVGGNYGLEKVDYSSLSKKASELDYHIMKELFETMVSKCNREARRHWRIPRTLLLVDSTTITVGKTRLPWAPYHGERSGIKLHVSYTPATDMPLQIAETTGLVHDGPVGEQLTDKRFILVEDRAYFKIKRIDKFVEDTQKFVIRMKENVQIVEPYHMKINESADNQIISDMTCQLGTEQNRSEKRHRVVSFHDNNGNLIKVVTNLYSLPAETIAAIYKARWQIETFFRWVKQNLNVPTLFGTTKNAVFNQLFAALIAYVLLRWMFQGASRIFDSKVISFVSFQRQLIENQLSKDWMKALSQFLKKTPWLWGEICP